MQIHAACLWCRMPRKRAWPCDAAAVRILAAAAVVACFALNVHHAWLLAAARRRMTAAVPPRATPPSPPPTPRQLPSTSRAASWLTTPARHQPRIVRVSSVRAHDVGLFHQAGLEVQVVNASTSPQPRRKTGRLTDASDMLLLPWRLPVAAAPHDIGNEADASGDLDTVAALSADVLWGQWMSHLQFFDPRLRTGMMVNSLMGLEHDTLGTPYALARSHQRCARIWGLRACNFTSAQLVLHSHRDVSRLETLFGDAELADLAAWREVAADEVRTVWLAKQATYHRSLVHARASMFAGRAIISSRDALPAGLWVVQPWPTSPLLWRHHRFMLRTWVAVPSVAPLRVYLLQDGRQAARTRVPCILLPLHPTAPASSCAP